MRFSRPAVAVWVIGCVLVAWGHSSYQGALATLEKGDEDLLAHRPLQAAGVYAGAVQSQPELWQPWQRLGLALMAGQHDADAVAALERARTIRGDALEVLLPLASLRVKQQQWNEAAVLLRQALRADPGNFEACLLMSRVEAGRGDLPRARRFVAAILERNVNFWPAHSELGRLAAEQNQWEQAAMEYRRALGSSYLADAVTGYNLGVALVNCRQVPAAVEALERAASLNPTLPEPHLLLGQLLSRSNPAVARQHLEHLLQLQPNGEAATQARDLLQQLGGS